MFPNNQENAIFTVICQIWPIIAGIIVNYALTLDLTRSINHFPRYLSAAIKPLNINRKIITRVRVKGDDR